METIKSYTDIEQSKKLAEILPIESADYHYIIQGEKSYFYPYSLSSDAIKDYDEEIKYIPCWSVGALLELMPKINGFKPIIDLNINSIRYEGELRDESLVFGNNIIETCYNMIVWLLENKYI